MSHASGTDVHSPRPCIRCGEDFRPVSSGNIYCGMTCQQKARADRARAHSAPLPDIACAMCSTVFTPSRTSARYCSLSCSKGAHLERVRVRHRVDPSQAVPCKHCGKPFFAGKQSHVFCTPTCKRRARADVERDRKAVKRCRSCKEDKPRAAFKQSAWSCEDCSDLRSSGRRRCSWCGEAKELSYFNVNRDAPDGASSRCRSCATEASRGRVLDGDDKRRRRSRQLLSKFNITIEQYEGLLAEQGGVCAICSDPPHAAESLHVDHDHSCCPDERKTCGQCVRALLCRHCNQALGFLRESPTRAEAAAAYLRRHHAKKAARDAAS